MQQLIDGPKDKTHECRKAQNDSGNFHKLEDIKGDDSRDEVFTYKHGRDVLKFQFISNKRVKCPKCGKDFKNILNHMQKSRCQIPQATLHTCLP